MDEQNLNLAQATPLAEQELWVITTYYNPCRFQRRLLNYRLFRRHLPVGLLAVEISCNGVFDLVPDDADILLALHGQDVMWQKERLLNLAAQALPARCRKVVWMDCDTIFAAEPWPERVSRALDDYPLVQPFDRVHHLACDAHLKDPRDPAAATFTQHSIPVAVAAGRPARECLGGVRDQLAGSYVMGMGWAMRRDLLCQLGIYDACIVGGGTRAFVSAAYGCFDETIRLNLMNDRQRDHYAAWAERFFQTVDSNVGAVDAGLFHLWHGSLEDRRYKERYEGLQRYGFDPGLDLTLAKNGVWRWNSDKPALHQYVRDYFAGRKEDG